MINHVLHDCMLNVWAMLLDISQWGCVGIPLLGYHFLVMYDWIVYTSSIINRITWSFTSTLHSYDAKITKWNLLNDTFGTRITFQTSYFENTSYKLGFFKLVFGKNYDFSSWKPDFPTCFRIHRFYSRCDEFLKNREVRLFLIALHLRYLVVQNRTHFLLYFVLIVCT